MLDENKSDDPRSWPLDPGVVRALKAFKPAKAEPKDLIFVEENGGEHNRHALAKTLREHLRAAGLEEGPGQSCSSTRRRAFRCAPTTYERGS